MKYVHSFIFLFIVLSSSLVCAEFLEETTFKRIHNGIYDSRILRILGQSQSTETLYVLGSSRLYVSFDLGKTFKMIFNQDNLKDLFIDDNRILIATDTSVYMAKRNVYEFEKIFTLHSNDDEYDFEEEHAEKVLSVLVSHKRNIYIGTDKDLYKRKYKESNFFKVKGRDLHNGVYRLQEYDENIYVSSKDSVYEINDGNGEVRKILDSGIVGISTMIDDFVIFEDNMLAVLKHVILWSNNKGDTWFRFRDIYSIGKDVSVLYPVTQEILTQEFYKEKEMCIDGFMKCGGFFLGTWNGLQYFYDHRSIKIYKGLESENIRDVRLIGNTLFVATNNGLFSMDITFIDHQPVSNFQKTYKESIISSNVITSKDVQEWAIEYADVHPNKIRQWHRDSKRKAFLPDLSLSLSGGNSWSRSNTLWGSSSSGNILIGPDDKGRSEDVSWGVSLRWRLGDLIWSSHQTSIDVRSRLMVQLREDILDQVIRLFFEWTRLNFELENDKENHSKSNFDKRLRIRELTAYLDAYTGGKFSQNVK